MNFTAKLAGLAALAVTAALAAPAVGHAAPIDTSKTYLITTSRWLALDISGASKGDGAALIQWGVNLGANQRWTFEPVWQQGDTIAYRIHNVNSGKCLTVPNGYRIPLTNVVQWVCGRAGQTWCFRPESNATGAFILDCQRDSVIDEGVTVAAKLHVDDNSGAWGLPLNIYSTYSTESSQLFTLTPLN